MGKGMTATPASAIDTAWDLLKAVATDIAAFFGYFATTASSGSTTPRSCKDARFGPAGEGTSRRGSGMKASPLSRRAFWAGQRQII
jgi:hypothetical protein